MMVLESTTETFNITQDFIELLVEAFNDINHQYFGNLLPKTTLKFGYMRKHQKGAFYAIGDNGLPCIELRPDMPFEELELTLRHEMIHEAQVYIFRRRPIHDNLFMGFAEIMGIGLKRFQVGDVVKIWFEGHYMFGEIHKIRRYRVEIKHSNGDIFDHFCTELIQLEDEFL